MDISLAVESVFLGVKQIRDTYGQLRKEGFTELVGMYHRTALEAASNGIAADVELATHGMRRSAAAIGLDISDMERQIYAVLTR